MSSRPLSSSPMRFLRRYLLGLFIALGAYLPTAPAGAFFLSGNDALRYCQEDRNFCIALVMGWMDATNSVGLPEWRLCVPDAFTADQGVAIFLKQIDDHPEGRASAASAIFLTEMKRQFACVQ